MNNKSWNNCCINLYKHSLDEEAHLLLVKAISEDDLLVIDYYNGNLCLGFRSYGIDIDVENYALYKNKLIDRLIPFVFKHDRTTKRFQDAITGTYFSYHTYDDSDERKFFEDKGETGEYLEESFTLSEEEAKKIRSFMNSNDIKTYRKALRRLEQIIKEVYSSYYKNVSKEKRQRERNKK